MSLTCFRTLILVAVIVATFIPQSSNAGDEKVQLKITGGDETDPRDRGRPVALVAGGLGVTPEVFRDAFRQVKPARGGTEPDPAQVRRNKEVLMAALARYKVTNDELDRVSNYYRYPPGSNKKWPLKTAAGYVLINDGAIKSIVITDRGSGYNSSPTVSVPGHPELALEANLAFNRDLKKNGSISSIAPAGAKGESRFELGQVLPPNAREELNLTAAQEKEIADLEKEAKQRLAKILTAEQKKKLESLPPTQSETRRPE